MPHAHQVRNRAHARPGWHSGRTSYAWLLPLGDQPQLRELANQYQYALRDLPGFDPVPLEWMHILLQEVGFTDEVSETDAGKLLETARTRLAGTGPLSLTFQDAVVLADSLALPADPLSAQQELRTTLRAVSTDAVAEGDLPPEPQESDQHVSLAYPTAEGPAVFASATLDATEVAAATIHLPAVSLVRLTRDHTSSSEWETVDRVELGG